VALRGKHDGHFPCSTYRSLQFQAAFKFQTPIFIPDIIYPLSGLWALEICCAIARVHISSKPRILSYHSVSLTYYPEQDFVFNAGFMACYICSTITPK